MKMGFVEEVFLQAGHEKVEGFPIQNLNLMDQKFDSSL